MWGVYISIFIALWLIQLLMTMIQVKHYRQTIRDMSKRGSGYLGVGVQKRKFGLGTVLIIVTNLEGIIIDCRIMSGVTVFSRFRNCKRFTNCDIFHILDQDIKYQAPLEMAIEKIKQQMNKSVSIL
ncbi:glucitol operon activator protein [Neobacillus niacini]|jgi:glucitol operon activator protein|uniref:transcriptional regulator GutM n=1 Tax=Neobacillus niacini TaxID=86668 RepID=UPI0027826710|nr:transcriptional regulator GutM [Neobacillus niacini]MDQ1004434.1 glucitol operon activator protein [Neobacillus niacini]